MNLAGYDFELVCVIAPIRAPNGEVCRYMPQAAFKNERLLPLNRYGEGPFCKFKIPNGYKQSGVYALLVSERVQYVGECNNLSQRYNMGYGNISPRNCFKGGQETNCRVNNLIYQAAVLGDPVSLWFHQTASFKIAELEILAIQRWNWNRR